MTTTPQPPRKVTGWFGRVAVLAVVVAALLAYLVLPGTPSPGEPVQLTHAMHAVPLLGDGGADGHASVRRTPSPPGPESPDAAELELEALDPVGAGHSPGPERKD